MDVKVYLEEKRLEVDGGLDRLLPPEDLEPKVIHEAIRYSVFTGGKRIRPILLLAAAEAVGGHREQILPAACAVEMVHTYSLIHDDLPCMDDDDFRRGKPTCHKVYGEMVAVLAGNALMNVAFQVLSREYGRIILDGGLPLGAALIDVISEATGTTGIIGGQVLDMLAEGNSITPEDLTELCSKKTGALFTACLEMGGLVGGADDRLQAGLISYGRNIGLAFQIIDDILDNDDPSAVSGDRVRGKATFPTVLGLDRSKKMAAELVEQAKSDLEPLGGGGDVLASLADFIVERTY
ncbi:polyprenyl synthetase family protein [candidate division KSB1 bacterium]